MEGMANAFNININNECMFNSLWSIFISHILFTHIKIIHNSE